MPLAQLLYRSRSTLTDADRGPELARILNHASTRNPGRRITGCLGHDGSHFAQVLEGPAEAVEGVLTRINDDPRHRDVAVLMRRTVSDRAFPEWSMLAVDAKADALPAIGAMAPTSLLLALMDHADRVRLGR